MQVAAIILASGSGSRFDGIKQLASINGEPMILRVVREVREAAEDVIVILGAHGEQILPVLIDGGVKTVMNEKWDEGMASSIAVGVKHVVRNLPETTHLLVALADQPYIHSQQYNRLIAEISNHPNTMIAASYGLVTGVPAIFPRSMWKNLISLRGDKGARALLRNTDGVVAVSIPEGARDIDTSGDISTTLN